MDNIIITLADAKRKYIELGFNPIESLDPFCIQMDIEFYYLQYENKKTRVSYNSKEENFKVEFI